MKVDRQDSHPIISFGPNFMFGQAYYWPATAIYSGFVNFPLVRAFDLLIVVGMQREFKQI